MKVEIKCVINENVTLKPNYVTLCKVSDEYRFMKILSIDNINNVCEIVDIFNKSKINTELYNITNCIKFIAITNTITLPVIYGDIISILESEISKYKTDLDKQNFINSFVEGSSIIVHGFEKKSFIKINPDDPIQIISLYLIDKYKLHNESDRIFTVKNIVYPSNINSMDKKYEIESVNGVNITCKRFDFKTIDKLNYKKLFTIHETRY